MQTTDFQFSREQQERQRKADAFIRHVGGQLILQGASPLEVADIFFRYGVMGFAHYVSNAFAAAKCMDAAREVRDLPPPDEIH